MRRLILLRHAKAEASSGRDDFDRALTESGREDAARMGVWLAARDLIPDLVVYSSAARTRETAEIAAARWPRPVKTFAEDGLYDATRHLVLMLVRALPDAAGVVLVIGHNPGIGDIATQLTSLGSEAERMRMAAKFPTSGLAVLDFPGDHWADVEPRTARLVRFVAPKDLDARPD